MANSNQPAPRQRLDINDVMERYCVASPNTIYLWYKNPEIGCPKPHFIGVKRLWWSDELDAWDEQRTAKLAAQKARKMEALNASQAINPYPIKVGVI